MIIDLCKYSFLSPPAMQVHHDSYKMNESLFGQTMTLIMRSLTYMFIEGGFTYIK